MNFKKVKSRYFYIRVKNSLNDYDTLLKMMNNDNFDYFIFCYHCPDVYHCIVSSKSGNAVHHSSIAKFFGIDETDIKRLSTISDCLESYILFCFYHGINIYDVCYYNGVFCRYVEKCIDLYDLQNDE